MESKSIKTNPDTDAERQQRLRQWCEQFAERPKHSGSVDNICKLLLREAGDSAVIAQLLEHYLAKLKRAVKDADANEQKTLAHKGLNLYAPLAERVGMQNYKAELEDLCFSILKPQQYQLVVASMRQVESGAKAYLKQLKQALGHTLQQAGIKVIEIKGRRKHAYSVYKKLAKAGDIGAVYDLVALRIIVPTTDLCYQALDAIHASWPPNLTRLKDYIAKPKANGYRSLHTTVGAPDRRLVEIQIRTPAMHQVAESGMASRVAYSAHKQSKGYRQGKAASAKQPAFGRRRVYAFSPGGDVYELPRGATALDFAFAVHTNIGLRARGAEINSRIAKFDQTIQNGNLVNILTQKTAAPRTDWLKLVKTAKARHKIRGWLRAMQHDTYVEIGKDMLAKSLSQAKLTANPLETARAFKYQSTDDLYVALGSGLLSTERVTQRLKQLRAVVKTPVKAAKLTGKVSISGISGLLYRLAPCCTPKTGDTIRGFISRGGGVIVHKQGCSNLLTGADRLIDCEWI